MDIERIAVLGSGEMGHGITELAAVNGFEVIMRDIDEDVLAEGYEKIEWSLEKLSEKGEIHQDPDEVTTRIETTTDLEEAVVGVDAVIEAVPEDLDLKREVFGRLDELVDESVLLATNTSGIPITDIAEGTRNPNRIVGMHFFNPVMLMDLIEIVRGRQTSDRAVEMAESLSEAFGKRHVVLRKDVPGFITSRTILPYMLEAAWQLHEGVAEMEEIDAAGKFELGFPMGPFELADQTGIDVPVKGVDEGAFREEYFAIAPNQRELVEEGRLGIKAGHGWHDWDEGEGCTASPDQTGAFDPMKIVAPTVNEAARLIEWDAADPGEIDLAMRLGTAYPKGPCRLGDELGLHRVVETLEENPRYEPVDLLIEMVSKGEIGRDAGKGFYEYTSKGEDDFYTLEVDHDGEEGVATVTLDRPQRQNSLNSDMFDELSTVLEQVEADEDVRCLVVKGNDTFCAGADISMLSGLSQYEFMTESMGEVFDELESLSVPTIAAVDGHCLGGGLELALACDFRLATEGSVFGTTEINLGLLPGAGGTQRLPRIVGLAKAKELVMLGRELSAAEAEDCGLVTEVVSPEEFDSTVDAMTVELADGPPIAQHAAKIALHQGADAPLDSGLALEQALVGILFGTDDLTEGIDAFFNDRRPEFSGE